MTVLNLDKIEAKSNLEKLARALSQVVNTQMARDLRREVCIGLWEKKDLVHVSGVEGGVTASREYYELYLTPKGLVEKKGYDDFYHPSSSSETRKKVNPSVALIEKYGFTAEDISNLRKRLK